MIPSAVAWSCGEEALWWSFREEDPSWWGFLVTSNDKTTKPKNGAEPTFTDIPLCKEPHDRCGLHLADCRKLGSRGARATVKKALNPTRASTRLGYGAPLDVNPSDCRGTAGTDDEVPAGISRQDHAPPLKLS